MTDLITLTGPLVDHQGAAPLPGVTVTATPSRDITRTSDGEDALTGAAATTDETGTFTLPLVHAAGLRYLIQYRVQDKVYRPYVLDCDSWPAGSTVTIADLPPIAGVPPSAVEDLQAWLLARLAEGMTPETVEAAIIAYFDENPVGIPAHNDTTGRDAADAHPMASITGLVAALAGKQAAGSYATAAQGAKADTAVQPESLHPVATSGQYGDLESLPDLGALPYRPDDWEPNPPDLSNLVADDDARLSDARTPTAHEHTAADIDAGASADGQVLTSDGLGGAAWETPASAVSTDDGQQLYLGSDSLPMMKPKLSVAGGDWEATVDVQVDVDQAAASLFTGDSSSGRWAALIAVTPVDDQLSTSLIFSADEFHATDPDGDPFMASWDSHIITRAYLDATAATDFATAAQGTKADTALQVGTPVPIVALSGAQTTGATHAGKDLHITASSGVDLTVQTAPAGSVIQVRQSGAGALTCVGDGVTLTAMPGMTLISAGLGARFAIVYTSSSAADVLGWMVAA